MAELIECRDCGREFQLKPGKPGFRNQCESCATEVSLLGGNMVDGECHVKPLKFAQEFEKIRADSGPKRARVVSSTKLTRKYRQGGAGMEKDSYLKSH